MSEKKKCCCSCSDTKEPDEKSRWVQNHLETPAGPIPVVSTQLELLDKIGSWKVRWAMARNKFTVPPGLYAVGAPDNTSQVFVTANYKMSFDHLRSDLHGQNGWIMVLDTQGVNVWCGAGKGTFGTDELVKRIEETGLAQLIEHRDLILPQLAASGVSAHMVRKQSGFRVIYGPVRSQDLPSFLNAGMKATPEMRKVVFGLKERAILVPVELVIVAKYMLLAAAVILLISGFGPGGYSARRILTNGPFALLPLLGAWLAGAVLGPLLLPVLPGRSFSLKGAAAGLLVVLPIVLILLHARLELLEQLAWIFLVPAVASFMTMNFTGASTYTSPSGVKKEMRVAVPIQALAALIGLGLLAVNLFV